MDAKSKSQDAPRTPSGVTGEESAERPPGRRRAGSHDPEGNRRAVLDAARRLFGAHGYRGAGVRAIAAEAGVTPGLVMAYFGTKDALFREVVGSGTGVTEDVLAAATHDTADVPAALAAAYLNRWDRLPADDPWPALIRSAIGHAPSAEMLRTILDTQVGAPLARLLGDGPGAEVRTALVRSVLFGVIMERYLFAHEPASSVPTSTLTPALTQVLTAAFTADAEGCGAAGAAADGAGVAPGPGGRAGAAGTATPPDPTGSHPAAPGSAPLTPPNAGAQPAADDAAGTAGPGAAGAGEAGAAPARGSAGDADGAVRPGAHRESAAEGGTPGGAAVFGGLAACAQRHQAVVGKVVRGYGISLPAYEVLAALREAGEPYRRTTGEVAARQGVGAGGLTQHADRLEAAGLIRRERDAGDRRIVHLCLTPEGGELADRVRAVRDAQEEELLAPLGPEDRRRLAALLGALGTPDAAGTPGT
ncbi:TetR family transcriptional regulator [Streptomyces zhihengii]|uniref:TetR/AcrR family transcriptional regulator n=1 Tax=Streptomyces zhihengii TaxID=1818004 RepID=UPI00367E02F1